MPVTLVVAHSSDSERSALVDLLWRVRDLVVVAQVATFEGVLDIVQMRRPGVVVIELGLLPEQKRFRSGFETAGAKNLSPLSNIQAIAIAARADDAAKALASRSGAAVLLDRKEARAVLVETIRRVTGSLGRGAAT